jgi:SMODS and SLOG-associating 2TM effector domain 2
MMVSDAGSSQAEQPGGGLRDPSDRPNVAGQLDSLDWDPEKCRHSLRQIFTYVQVVGSRSSSWYRQKKRSRQIISVLVRLASLSLLLLGGLCPLIPLGLLTFNPQAYGYLLLAAGGGLLLFDRLFGISSSWMRYMIATQQIELTLELFRISWLKIQVIQRGAGESEVDALPFLSLASDTLLSIGEIVQSETREWTNEFQSNVAYLASMAESKRLLGEAKKDTSRSKL